MESKLWSQYWQQRSLSSRNDLIVYYCSFAKATSLNLYSNWVSSELLPEDFIQYGTVGLIEAIERYKTGKNASFKTYARYRIRGSILNAIFSFSEYLDYHSYQRKIKNDRLNSIHDHASLEAESAFDRFLSLTLDYAVGQMIDYVDLDEKQEMVDENLYAVPDEYCIRRQLLSLIDKLPDRHIKIIKMHYLEGLTFTEIARIMEMSKASISNLHAKSLELMRKYYRNEDALDVVV